MNHAQKIADRFEVGVLIGRGGMGDVYRGTDTLTGQPVAIKFLKPEIVSENPELVARFEREGEALRALNHPNIVKMLASAEGDGQRCIVMEYVGGGSLRELLMQQPRLPVDRVLLIALDLSDALTRAHRLKIVHRDLKPANVLLAEDGTPRLSDFGVAHISDRTRVTETGSLIGTYAYLSPEACMGEDLDARTDIWSFGVLLFELLAGQRPFEANQPAAILTAILTKPLPDLLALRPDAPPALVSLIYTMLDKNRDQRINSVRLVGAQLEAILSGADTPTGSAISSFAATPLPVTVTPVTPTPTVPLDDSPTMPPTPTPAKTPTASQNRQPLPRKQVVGGPRIFLSYRRDDSSSITGRIYDRLVSAFGDDHIFKDVDKIPPGVNFKAVLENEVSSCDVLLVIAGQQWVDARDQQGQRRLDNPDDFVRIEVEAGLKRDDTLVIPVLVNNAVMPAPEHLPTGLNELAYHNAAVVRNDPDFNRDVAWLIEQIQANFDIVPLPKAGRRRARWLAALAGAVLLVVAAALFLPELLAGSQPVTVAPVQSGEYMVLVTEIDHQGGPARDVTGAVVNDLTQQLERDVPFSQMRIRRSPRPAATLAEARALAEQVGAAVVVRGGYDERGVNLEVASGSLAPFRYNLFARDAVEQVIQAQVHLTDERTQSAALPILAVMQGLLGFDGDGVGMARNTASAQLLTQVDGVEIQGNSSAARLIRLMAAYMRGDSDTALALANQTIDLDARSPLAYAARGLIRQKMGDLQLALDDARTAQSLGPDGWTSPVYLLANTPFLLEDNPASALPEFDRLVELRPDDPNVYTMRALVYYSLSRFEPMNADATQANALGSSFNSSYFLAVEAALRDGRLTDAQALIRLVLERFPDPGFASRMAEAIYGAAPGAVPIFATSKAFGNLVLRQWRTVIASVNEGAQLPNAQLADLYLMQGIAYCNLRDYPAAEAAYGQGIEIDASFTLLHMLRAEARVRQQNMIGAAADLGAVLQSPHAEMYRPLLPVMQSGALNCENMFDYDLAALVETTAEAAPAAETTPAAAPPTAVPTLPPTATASPTPIIIEPVAANEYMVLVAEFEPLDGQMRDVARFIARDLRRKLEEEVPFSQVRVREYPRVLRTEAEARAAAESAGATAVVWGSYTPALIEAEVQLGSTAGFPTIQFERAMLERTADTTLRLTDPRTESLVNPVLGALAVLHLADGNGYEVLRTLAVLDQIGAATPTIDGSGVSAHFNRYIEQYVADTPAALAEISAAITLDPANALLYASRSASRQRAGQLNESRQDARSAARSGPAGWAIPLYLEANIPFLQNDADAALPLYDQLIQLRPDDWYFYHMRGSFYYLKDDLARAKADYDRAMALQPNANFPYVISGMIALREGRMADARQHMDTILHQFTDPLFASRISRVAFGDQRGSPFGAVFAAFGYLVLDQYDQMLTAALDAVAIDGRLSDLYAIAGYAYCNLRRFEEAEAAYTHGIEMKPTAPIGYALRAEVRLKQLNVLGANADAARARQLIRETGQAQELEAYITAGLLLQVGCNNFWDWKPPGSPSVQTNSVNHES